MPDSRPYDKALQRGLSELHRAARAMAQIIGELARLSEGTADERAVLSRFYSVIGQLQVGIDSLEGLIPKEIAP